MKKILKIPAPYVNNWITSNSPILLYCIPSVLKQIFSYSKHKKVTYGPGQKLPMGTALVAATAPCEQVVRRRTSSPALRDILSRTEVPGSSPSEILLVLSLYTVLAFNNIYPFLLSLIFIDWLSITMS